MRIDWILIVGHHTPSSLQVQSSDHSVCRSCAILGPGRVYQIITDYQQVYADLSHGPTALPDTNTNYAMWLWKYPKTGLCSSLAKRSWPGMSAMSHGRCSTSQRLSQPSHPCRVSDIVRGCPPRTCWWSPAALPGPFSVSIWETETNSWGFGNQHYTVTSSDHGHKFSSQVAPSAFKKAHAYQAGWVPNPWPGFDHQVGHTILW